MIQTIDINKTLDVMLKYKLQLTFLGVLFLLLLSFKAGQNSVDLPSKKVFCKEYTDTIEQYRIDLQRSQDKCDERIDNSVDVERKSCDEKIVNAIQEKVKQSVITNCRIAKIKFRQCKKKGLIK